MSTPQAPKITVRKNSIDTFRPPVPNSVHFGVCFGDPKIHRLFRLYNEHKFSDFLLLCHGKEFFVHKCILSCSCLFFERLFDSEWKESETGSIHIPDHISHDALEHFLIFLYTGKIQYFDLEQFLFELYELADYFQVITLRNIIRSNIMTSLSLDNIEEYVGWFGQQCDEELQNSLITFVAKNSTALAVRNFPFHKLGNEMIDLVFRKQAYLANPKAFIESLSTALPSSVNGTTTEPPPPPESISQQGGGHQNNPSPPTYASISLPPTNQSTAVTAARQAAGIGRSTIVYPQNGPFDEAEEFD